MRKRSNRWLLLRPACLSLAACVMGCGDDLYDAQEVKSFSEGATFHISDDALVPYRQIKGDLQPGFEIQNSVRGSDGKPIAMSKGDAALTKVLPTTGYYE